MSAQSGDSYDLWMNRSFELTSDSTQIDLESILPDRCHLSPTEFHRYYISSTSLGSGGFGQVQMGIDSETQEEVAIKIVSTDTLNSSDYAEISKECSILSKLHHPNIISIYGGYQTSNYLYWIFPLAKGGDMFQYLRTRSPLQEMEARSIFRQLVEAIDYCHHQGVIHRDIKLENILILESSVDSCHIVLTDFGLAKDHQFLNQSELTDVVGSALYVAPEMLGFLPRYAGQPADIWAMGVCLYIMIMGMYPFYGRTRDIIFESIRFDIPLTQTSEIKMSLWLQNFLVEGILNKSPTARFTISDIRNHPWYVSND